MTTSRPQNHPSQPPPIPGGRTNSIIFYSFLLLLVLSPIPYGSNREWSWSLAALIISTLVLIWGVNALWYRRSVSLSLPAPIIGLFLFACLWAGLQLSTMLPDSWGHPLWGMSAKALNITLPARVSLTPDNGVMALMRLLSYGLVFFLAFQYCRNVQRAETLLKWISAAAVLYALYGLAVYWGNVSVFFWIEQSTVANKVSSTFINRNSYVMYAGLGLICLIAQSLGRQMSRHAAAPYKQAMGRQEQIEFYVLSSWKPLLALMLLTTALISTQSRGGFISAGPAIIGLLMIYGLKARLSTGKLFIRLSSALVVILLAFAISNDPLLARLGDAQSGGAERLKVYALTLDAIENAPLTGFGYGSFYESFRMYRSDEIQYIYDKAHNTYLENIFELGIPAAFALFMAIFGLWIVTIKGVIRRHRDWLYPAVGVAATVLVGIHSLVDFSLQIPAIAITYAAIMGMAVAQSFSSVKMSVK